MKKIIGSIVISAALNTVAMAQTSESFGGLGISVYSGKNGASVAAVLPNSPAAQTGLQAGDVIVSVNGVPLSSIAPENQIFALRGDAGSSVNLLVQRNGENITLSAKRAGISVQNLESSEVSAWFGKSEGLTVDEISYLASQKVGEGYEFLGVMQNGFLISAESLNLQSMQQISIKKSVANADNYPPLQSARETVTDLNLEKDKNFSLINAKGARIKMKSGNVPAYRVK
jgi:membrane-associated protease RseP (regulator of RpoE activity)